jgi:hypothetical protein
MSARVLVSRPALNRATGNEIGFSELRLIKEQRDMDPAESMPSIIVSRSKRRIWQQEFGRNV